MRSTGKLYVFEGPDGVGKSVLSRRFAVLLESRGVSTQLLTFPGKEEGTLGKIVYELHHDPKRFGIRGVSASSIQLLHIAAHLDAIERAILPALGAGITVVLDRFWWSTKVYGLASGMSHKTLDAMIAVELAAWGIVKPTGIFLITRDMPLRPEPERLWQKWKELYQELAAEQQHASPVAVIENSGSLESTLDKILSALGPNQPILRSSSQLGSLLQAGEEKRKAPYVFSGLVPAQPTVVYDTYWRFATERQSIFFKRLRGLPPPWTNDPVLGKHKFTNAYRASDRTSQHLIRKVIYKGEQTAEEIFFRTILFKMFNKIDTWELFLNSLGLISYREFDIKTYDRLLIDAMASGKRIYSAAYIMPSGSRSIGTTRKHRTHLKLLGQMMADEVPLRIAECKRMLDAFTILRSYPMMGDFLAYQYVTDLNYSTLTDFSEMEFVVPGPGAKGGLSKCFDSLGGLSEADIIRVVTERQREEFQRLGLNFESLWGRSLQLIDCQNLFCEVDKYARVMHPEYSGTSQRTRIKQKFRSNNDPVDYWYPPKWGINQAIERERKEDHS